MDKKTIRILGGLGDALDSQVLRGAVFTSNNGIRRLGTFKPAELFVGGEKPNEGPWLWFDNQMKDIPESGDALECVLILSVGENGDIIAELEEQNYSVENSVLNEQDATDNSVVFKILD